MQYLVFNFSKIGLYPNNIILVIYFPTNVALLIYWFFLVSDVLGRKEKAVSEYFIRRKGEKQTLKIPSLQDRGVYLELGKCLKFC